MAAVTITAATAYLLYASNESANEENVTIKENVINYNPPSQSEKDAGTEAKNNFLNNGPNDGTTIENPTNPEPNENNTAVTITSTNVENGNLAVRAIIGRIDGEGACKLSMKKTGEAEILLTSGTQVTRNYSVCKGFDIATNNLSKGDWTLTITYSSQDGSNRGSSSAAVGV